MRLDIDLLAEETVREHGNVHLGDVVRRLSTNRVIRRITGGRPVDQVDDHIRERLVMATEILEYVPAAKHLDSNFVTILKEAGLYIQPMNAEEQVEKAMICRVRDNLGQHIGITREQLNAMGLELFGSMQDHSAKVPVQKLQEISLEILHQTIKVSVENLFRARGLLSQRRKFFVRVDDPDGAARAIEEIQMVINVRATVEKIAKKIGIPLSNSR